MAQTFIFSNDGNYRYLFAKQWDKNLPRVCFIMLNPTEVNGSKLNSTLRRCLSYAKTWGYGAIDIVNLYALLASRPDDLFKHLEPIGEENDFYIRKSVRRSDEVILAWGNFPMAKERENSLLKKKFLKQAKCLKKTKFGSPAHPLYLKKDLTPKRFF